MFHEERFDHEGFDDEEVHGEQVFQKHNDFGLNVSLGTRTHVIRLSGGESFASQLTVSPDLPGQK